MKTLISLTDKDFTGSQALLDAPPRLAVGLVLFDGDGKIAIQHIGQWDAYNLPGGGVDAGESLTDAAKRETWEECGCRCEIVAELGKSYENSVQRNFVMERYFYLAKVVGEKGPLNLEDYEIASQTGVEWFTPKEALPLLDESRPVQKGLISAMENDTKVDAAIVWNFIRRRDLRMLEEALRLIAEKPGILGL